MKNKIAEFFKKKFRNKSKPVKQYNRPLYEAVEVDKYYNRPLIVGIGTDIDFTLSVWINKNHTWTHVLQSRTNCVLKTEFNSIHVSNHRARQFNVNFVYNEVQHSVTPVYVGFGTEPTVTAIVFYLK